MITDSKTTAYERGQMDSDSVNLGSNPSSPATQNADNSAKNAPGHIGQAGQTAHSARTNVGTAHTRGPWAVYDGHSQPPFAKNRSVWCPDAGHIVANTNYMTPAIAEANARLIAAAPDLLLALRDVIGLAMGLAEDDSFYAEQRGADAIIERAQAIIAKATGATP